MAYGHEQHAPAGAGDPGSAAHALHADHGPRVLPSDLSAPPIVAVWKTRALFAAVAGLVLSVILAFFPLGFDHVLRAYLLAFILCFGLAGGGLCMLMLQYVSGGKWGLILRRPLEAMTRTLPFIVVLFVPLLIFGKRLWLWAAFPTHEAVENALNQWFVK